MVFVRLQGCNLRCKWCDTPYAQAPLTGDELSPPSIRSQVVLTAPQADWVCITGGEPLSQARRLHELVQLLHEREYKVEIETNGSFLPPKWWEEVDSWCVDVKCPSSGQKGSFLSKWTSARPQDQLKFVVDDETDLEYTYDVFSAFEKGGPTTLLSPTMPNNREWLHRCARFCLVHNIRFSLQLHKVVWEPSTRGV